MCTCVHMCVCICMICTCGNQTLTSGAYLHFIFGDKPVTKPGIRWLARLAGYWVPNTCLCLLLPNTGVMEECCHNWYFTEMLVILTQDEQQVTHPLSHSPQPVMLKQSQVSGFFFPSSSSLYFWQCWELKWGSPTHEASPLPPSSSSSPELNFLMLSHYFFLKQK